MLSKKAKYALKAMLALAECPQGELLQAADIAESQNIPKKFLDLILQDLRNHGFIHSHRGKQGGYMLGKSADKITIGQIVRVIDGPLAPIACASVTAYQACDDCTDEKRCVVRWMMREVRDAASEILDQTSLAEALEGASKKKRKLAHAR